MNKADSTQPNHNRTEGDKAAAGQSSLSTNQGLNKQNNDAGKAKLQAKHQW